MLPHLPQTSVTADQFFVVCFAEEQSDEASSEHGDACALCGEAGELLCCDTCPLAYHLTCAFPPLRRVPRGNWACQVCTGADEDRARKDRVKKATIEGNVDCAQSLSFLVHSN